MDAVVKAETVTAQVEMLDARTTTANIETIWVNKFYLDAPINLRPLTRLGRTSRSAVPADNALNNRGELVSV